MKRIKVNIEDVFTPKDELIELLDAAQEQFNDLMNDLNIITQLLDFAHPEVIRPYLNEFLEGFHIVESDRLINWIDKVITAVCEYEMYELAADLLKIRKKV
jgi:hypothetical protein